ncbi:hypothetical protein [Polyangium aurulentum]|uniref:hypothetical protein n=1 Tax=Polyangium aurulentum TaxID=2567896 RepID=UPI0010AEDABF|nr:hypothetical protein [Polyangium aurulentum]UQA54841.1 hypothetical protein E8A73_026100 [Polyangium aurulentum]
MNFDRNGWAASPVEPLPTARAYTLLSPDPAARIDLARWAHQARTFFGAKIELVQPKRYPEGKTPSADMVDVEIERRGDSVTRVHVVTLPLDEVPDALTLAAEGARAIGGAGFDALVDRARRVWQIADEVSAGGDASAPLALAAVMASVLLAPIVPPGGGTIFGVKGARTRLGL